MVPGATGYYIIDRPSSCVPISCRDPWRSPGITGSCTLTFVPAKEKTFAGTDAYLRIDLASLDPDFFSSIRATTCTRVSANGGHVPSMSVSRITVDPRTRYYVLECTYRYTYISQIITRTFRINKISHVLNENAKFTRGKRKRIYRLGDIIVRVGRSPVPNFISASLISRREGYPASGDSRCNGSRCNVAGH